MNIQYTLSRVDDLSDLDKEKINNFLENDKLELELRRNKYWKYIEDNYFLLTNKLGLEKFEIFSVSFAEVNNEIIGLCLFRKQKINYEGPYYHTYLYVNQDFRKNKIGSKLIKLIAFNNAGFDLDTIYESCFGNDLDLHKFVKSLNKLSSFKVNGNLLLDVMMGYNN